MSEYDYGLGPDNEIRVQHRWLGEEKKSHYIPGWYSPHKDLELDVRHAGEPQGMKIRNVLPFRRWALTANGETLNQGDFEREYLRYLSGFGIAEGGQYHNEAIPNVKVFVRAKYDHVGGLIDFASNDTGEVLKPQKFTQDGDIAPEFLARQEERAEESGGMRVLAKLMASGAISTEEFAAQATKLLGNDIPVVVAKTDLPAPPQKKIGRPRGPMSDEAREAMNARMSAMRARRKTSLVVSQPPSLEAI